MSFEHFERGYLLPKGCKDLLDAIKLRAEVPPRSGLGPSTQPQAAKGDVLISEHTTVRELAVLLGVKPFQVIADAMALGVFAKVNQALGFEVITRIALKYGYTARSVINP